MPLPPTTTADASFRPPPGSGVTERSRWGRDQTSCLERRWALAPCRSAGYDAKDQRDAPELDDVAVVQLRVGDAHAVDEGAVGAAVVEDPRALAVVDDDRVAPRDALVLEAQVGREAAPEVGHRLVQRDQPRDLAVLDRQVAAGRRAREGEALAARAVAQDAMGLELLGRPVSLGRGAGRCAGHGRHLIGGA